MNTSNAIASSQRFLIGHGAILIFIGGLIGFGFLFFLIGKITLWPIPGELDIQLPGTYDAWRMAHMEGIVNGLFLWLSAALLPVMPFSDKGIRRLAVWIAVIGWTIVVASALDPLFENSRGLAFGPPFTNNIAFFLFYVGVVAVMVVMALIAYRCLKPSTKQTEINR